jgi:hypothetical protein
MWALVVPSGAVYTIGSAETNPASNNAHDADFIYG